MVRVANRLLTANRHLAEMQRDWAVTVVADDQHVNAYAMEVRSVALTGLVLVGRDSAKRSYIAEARLGTTENE